MNRQASFDQRARARYHDAAAALSPAMQGRLRAARRTALAGTAVAGRHVARPLSMPIAAMAAAVLALAFGLRLQAPDRATGPGREDAAVPVATTPPTIEPGRPARPAPAQQVGDQETLLSMLDEDPDFFLWLGSDEPLPATLEQRHDPS